MEKDVCNCAKSNDTQGQGQIPGPGASESAKETAVVEDTGGDMPGVIGALARLPGNAIISLDGLAKVLGRCTMTVRRGIRRGELPPPVRVAGKASWTVNSILQHITGRLEQAQRDRERMLRKTS